MTTDPNKAEKELMERHAAIEHERYLRQQTEKVREAIRGMTDSDRDRVPRDAVKPEASA